MLHFWEVAMSRIPQPAQDAPKAWRPEPLPADYSDDVSDANFEALRRISKKEVEEEDFVLADGPAW